MTDQKLSDISNKLTLAGSTRLYGVNGTTSGYTNMNDVFSYVGDNLSGAYEAPLTFSTGLTRTGDTITLNDAQSIHTLSNLTANGFITTSGGGGALSVDTTAYTPASTTVNGHALSSNVTISKSDLGIAAVENTALSTWAGTANITILGTIATGAWRGTAIADAYISSAAAWNAKIGGSTGSADNRLVRSDGAGGATAQSTGITVSDNDEISGFRSLLVTDATTARTLAATDTGTTLRFTNAGAVTVTLPNNLAAGFTVEIIQGAAGQISFTAASGATLNNRQSQTKTYGQYSAVRLAVVANSGGTSAIYNLAGDTGA